MGRSNPEIRIIFDTANPRHRLVFALLWYSFVVALFGLPIYGDVTHHPIDFYKLFLHITELGSILFISTLFHTGLWSKPLFRRSPLCLIFTIFLWGLFLYPVVTHFPIDFFALLCYLASFAVVLWLQIKALEREWKTAT